LDREEFETDLRDALNHLHDPSRLCRSPIADVLGVAGRRDTYGALQQILIEGIGTLEPAPDVPAHSRAWRIYDLLICRYVQQLSGPVVSEQLGVSLRHLRREQHAAIEALAYHLWESHRIGERIDEDPAGRETTEGASSPTVREELSWLEERTLGQATSLVEAIPLVVELAGPLAERGGVRFETVLADGVPDLAVHQVALRQILLNVLALAAGQCHGGTVRIEAGSLRWGVQISVAGRRTRNGDLEDSELMAMCRELVGLCRGSIVFSSGSQFEAVLSLPAFERLPVLVIDDNADTLSLVSRFAMGTRYRVVCAQSVDQALKSVESIHPEMILLDVMMPDVDGWQVLGLLRQHPLTECVPVVVCTVLPQEDLALSLGASGFLRKPLTQDSFLAALDQHVADLVPEVD
jgi:CheY-like chemotaxis protein